MYIADLHIHSRFSRATSRDGDAPHLDWWARRKGIGLIGTGDFTHPAWRAELHEQLEPAGAGVYTLKQACRLPHAQPGEAPRFVVTGEISSIYKRHGKTRKVHNLILLPSLEAADELAARLEAVGNIHSDGRPILGMDSRDLLELTLDACPDAEFIPAHIWTLHFSMFGAFSGFDSMEECFDDLTPAHPCGRNRPVLRSADELARVRARRADAGLQLRRALAVQTRARGQPHRRRTRLPLTHARAAHQHAI